MKAFLRCPVRGCAERLQPAGRQWTCVRNHSFDQHRSGALNLLQPQDTRSRKPGDSKEASLARRRLSRMGHVDSVYRALGHVIHSNASKDPACLLDVGCGEGSFLGSLDENSKTERHGLDISAPSIELAAKAFPQALFVVGNADRFLPYADRSFDFVTSIDARTNAPEFDRVLTDGGLILVAVPGSDDLIELRERIQGAGVLKSRSLRVEEGLGEYFALVDKTTVCGSHTFAPSELRDLLTSTYRGFRPSERAAVESLTPMRVTLSHEILVFRRP